MEKILFVCTGNTCRSPMAEAIFNRLASECGLSFRAHSAGIYAQDGARASDNAILAAKAFGGDLSAFRSRMLSGRVINESRYICCMARSHAQVVLSRYPERKDDVFVLCEDTDILDPYMGSVETYEKCAKNIRDGVYTLIGKLVSLQIEESGGEILKMSREHASGVALVERECFSVPWTEGAFLNEVQNPAAFYFVYVEEERVLGYAGFHAVLDEGYITNVAVGPKSRRRGIADKLILRVIEEGEKLGLSFLSLEVRVSNSPAIKLYEKHGFVKRGMRKNYYVRPDEDAIIMTRTLKGNGQLTMNN